VARVLNEYPYDKRLTKRRIRDCHKLEHAALDRNRLAVFSKSVRGGRRLRELLL
jgi:hypothetical protein